MPTFVWNQWISLFKIPLDKKVTANCLVEIHKKPTELILAVIEVTHNWFVVVSVWCYNWYGIPWALVVNDHLKCAEVASALWSPAHVFFIGDGTLWGECNKLNHKMYSYLICMSFHILYTAFGQCLYIPYFNDIITSTGI